MRKRAPIPSSSATLFGTFSLSLSSLLIADDVTPRPCHVARGQDGRPGSGGYLLPYFTPVYLFLFFRSVFPLPEKYRFSLSLAGNIIKPRSFILNLARPETPDPSWRPDPP